MITRKLPGKMAKDGPIKTVTAKRIVLQKCATCKFWNLGQCYRFIREDAGLRVDGDDEARVFTKASFGCVQGERN